MSEAGAGPVVGVDVGGTKLLAVRVDVAGELPDSPEFESNPRTAEDLVRDTVEAGRRLGGGRPAALGIGVPGLVDGSDRLLFAANLPGAAGVPLGAELRQALPSAAVWVGNDATAACWAEHRVGAGRGSDHMLMVTLGTGIGGGIVADGRLVEGANRFGGEFGHMVVDPSGPHCPCGKKGCWERMASGGGLGVLGRELAMAGRAPGITERAGGDPENVRGEHVTAAAGEGAPDAVEAMARFGWWVALGLANLTSIFDPQTIVLGGGLVRAGEVLLQPTRRAFAELLFGGSVRPEVAIVPAALGHRAGAIGAGLLAGEL